MNLLMGYPGDGAARPVMHVYEGDTATALSFAMKTSAGAAIDLSGYDSAYLSAAHGTSWPFDLAEMTITAGAGGTLTITPTSAQVATVGKYSAVIRFVDGGVTTYSEPFTINVVATGVNPAISDLSWTEIRVFGQKYTTPAVFRWRVEVLTATDIIAACRVYYRKTPITTGSFYNSMESPCYILTESSGALGILFTGNSQVQQLFDLLLNDVTLEDGGTITQFNPAIRLDTDDFTTAGGVWMYYTPTALTGTVTAAAAPADGEYQLESP